MDSPILFIKFVYVEHTFYVDTDSANSLAGKIHSSLRKEKPICCGMGNEGVCCCIMLCPLAIYSPTGGLGAFCCVTNYLRYKTMEKYGVEESNVCNCSSPGMNTMCNFCCYGFHYPCALFQMLVSIEYWEQEETLPLGDNNSLTGNSYNIQ
jgi:hypothetical protein